MEIINVSFPNDGLGDKVRNAFVKVNSNFSELDSGKVDKIVGKGLSTNDYTNIDKALVSSSAQPSDLALKANIASPTFTWFVGIDAATLSPTSSFQIKLDGTETLKIEKDGKIKASKFELYGGSATSFLMADGSTNSAKYITAATSQSSYYSRFGSSDPSYIEKGQIYETAGNVIVGSGSPTMGGKFEVLGSIVGTQFKKVGGLSTEILMADGSSTSGSLSTTGALTGSGGFGTNITISMPAATTSVNGYLTAANWTTFNNKQAAITNPISGSGTTNTLPKFTGTSSLGPSNITDNGTNIGLTGGTVTITSNASTPYSNFTANKFTFGARGSGAIPYLGATSTNQTQEAFTLLAMNSTNANRTNWYDMRFVTQYDTGADSVGTLTATGKAFGFLNGVNELLCISRQGTVIINGVTDNGVDKMQVSGSGKFTNSVQVGSNTATASLANVGAIRYRTSGSNSYTDMSMQTGASTYTWVNILQNNY